jgi:hypothetical protein
VTWGLCDQSDAPGFGGSTRHRPEQPYRSGMRKMPSLLVTCVVSLVCGFLGALGAVTAFQGQLQGPQGATGLAGPQGERGAPGLDGRDGVDGERGPRGASGKAAKAKDVPKDIGTTNCVGRSVEVVTDVTINKDQEMRLEKQPVCVSG